METYFYGKSPSPANARLKKQEGQGSFFRKYDMLPTVQGLSRGEGLV
jgi:hypothetical protein